MGNGQMDGINVHERQSSMTLWAISSTPLYTGDDLTKLDDRGRALLTNREVIAQDQQGVPARPLNQNQEVWTVKNTDGTYTVALFNLGDTTKSVSVAWRDLGFSRASEVRDMWRQADLGPAEQVSPHLCPPTAPGC